MRTFAIAFAVLASCQLAPLDVRAEPVVIDPLAVIVTPAGDFVTGPVTDTDGNVAVNAGEAGVVNRDTGGDDAGTFVSIHDGLITSGSYLRSDSGNGDPGGTSSASGAMAGGEGYRGSRH